MEMMHWDAGVKNVVIGGRPSYGSMQTPSGSRAARYYDVAELDDDILNAFSVDADGNAIDDGILPNRTNQDVYIYDAGVSLPNQVRQGETTPLQMQYEAADCRIFYTPLTFNNFTNLWKHAAEAMLTWIPVEQSGCGDGWSTTGHQRRHIQQGRVRQSGGYQKTDGMGL